MAETIAGGYYIGEDGRPHDAFGRPLVDGQPVIAPADEPKPLFSEEQLVQMFGPASDAPVPPAKAAKPKRGQ
ncbi:MAG: hypothetical protein KAX65_01820 [Caldilineaceae bacterium]|nr:hypothetical protein [Caldilineaceae bacterium]